MIPAAVFSKAITWLAQVLSREKPIMFQVIKELDTEDTAAIAAWKSFGYHAVATEPEMTLPLRPSWKSMDDYRRSLKKKYRQRYRSTRKKGRSLSSRFLSAAELRERVDELQPLLRTVIERSNFSLTTERI